MFYPRYRVFSLAGKCFRKRRSVISRPHCSEKKKTPNLLGKSCTSLLFTRTTCDPFSLWMPWSWYWSWSPLYRRPDLYRCLLQLSKIPWLSQIFTKESKAEIQFSIRVKLWGWLHHSCAFFSLPLCGKLPWSHLASIRTWLLNQECLQVESLNGSGAFIDACCFQPSLN